MPGTRNILNAYSASACALAFIPYINFLYICTKPTSIVLKREGKKFKKNENNEIPNWGLFKRMLHFFYSFFYRVRWEFAHKFYGKENMIFLLCNFFSCVQWAFKGYLICRLSLQKSNIVLRILIKKIFFLSVVQNIDSERQNCIAFRCCHNFSVFFFLSQFETVFCLHCSLDKKSLLSYRRKQIKDPCKKFEP